MHSFLFFSPELSFFFAIQVRWLTVEYTRYYCFFPFYYLSCFCPLQRVGQQLCLKTRSQIIHFCFTCVCVCVGVNPYERVHRSNRHFFFLNRDSLICFVVFSPLFFFFAFPFFLSFCRLSFFVLIVFVCISLHLSPLRFFFRFFFLCMCVCMLKGAQHASTVNRQNGLYKSHETTRWAGTKQY